MSKIRINELARELEVKPGAIIDLLPELGVADKKTHSSSLDDDIVLALRGRLVGGAHSGTAAEPEFPHKQTSPVAVPVIELPKETDLPREEIHAPAKTAPADLSHAEPPHKEPPRGEVPGRGPEPDGSRPAVENRDGNRDGAPHAAPAAPEAAATAPPAVRRSAFPLRPPLAHGQQNLGRPAGPPSIPLQPPPAQQTGQSIAQQAGQPVTQQRTAQPAAPTGSPQSGPSAPLINRAPAIPVRPVPPTPARPGQILSGPRQPLPPPAGQSPLPGVAGPSPSAPATRVTGPGSGPGVSIPGSATPPTSMMTPGAPRPGVAPSLPSPRVPLRPASAPVPGAAMPPSSMMVGGPSAPLRPPSRQVVPGQQHPTSQHPPSQYPASQRPGMHPTGQNPAGQYPPSQHFAGQPSARPVVPPRADLVARLAKPPAAATPGLPRPGIPASRSSSPVPGRPIYTGPVRPGQPMGRGPGAPPGSYPQRPGGPPRGRPMHPTSPLRAEPATLPADPGRRHATKPSVRGAAGHRREDEEGRLRPQSRRQESFQPPPIDREITIAEGITVKELSEKLGIKGNLLVKRLVEKKIFATINQTLDVKLAEELARDFGASTNKLSYEEESTHDIQQTEVDDDREKRPPVVTIMGHVDHGKTSLLDAIREANVAGGEAGGITQHIGAYHVEKNGKNIVFIDTPGHEAFTRMRARGAKVTDIVVLVVAADDGVMPQTLEAIDHAKAAGVPIIVAINKIDKPGAQQDRIKQQLSDRGLLWDDWGGDTVMVGVSAKTKEGIDTLLEMILLVADIQDLKANPARPAMGSVLEAKLDRGRGPVATVLVRNGTLKVGDYFICGSVFGRVRAMFGDSGLPVREVGPSMPAEVLGLESLPEVGDMLQVVTDTAKAKQIVIYRESKAREVAMSKTNRITLDQLHDQLKEGEVKELNIILKTDVGGTAEVLTDTLQKLSNDKVKIRVLHAGVGAITETDVLLASASNAIIIGFNVRPERNAQATADHEKVDIRLHTIIYELADEMKKAMTGMLEPVFKQVYKGRAQVREVFRISKVGAVAGCQVDDGVILRSSEVRVVRDGKVVHTGKIDALKRFKNDASEVKQGFECGISLVGFNDIKPGDVIEAFVTERVAVEAIA